MPRVLAITRLHLRTPSAIISSVLSGPGDAGGRTLCGERMNNCVPILLAGILAASVAVALAANDQYGPSIDLRDARKHVGKNVTVCGRVVTHHCARPKRTTYLDLETPYWSGGVSVAIPAASRSAFGTRVEDRFKLRTVCATGRVAREDQRYVVTVSQPAEVRIDSQPQPPPVLLEPTAVRACDEGVDLPQVITRVKPEYPADAQATGVEGFVLLDGVVLTDGAVGEVVIVHSLDSASSLDAEAVKAFKKWRFVPGAVAGRPVPVIVGVQLGFKLQ